MALGRLSGRGVLVLGAWVLFSSTSALSARDCGVEECGAGEPADDVSMLAQRQQLRRAAQKVHGASKLGHGAAGRAKTVPDAQSARMDEVIDAAFAGVQGPGSYLKRDIKNEESYLVCNGIDWSAADAGEAAGQAMLAALGFDEYCSPGGKAPGDATCLAIAAALEATRLLQAEFPEGPRFHNAYVTSWGKHSSWSAGAVEAPDMATMPPTAKVLDPNGMNGFALCDIIRVVLTQSAHQETQESCTHFAPLAALSHKAPAKAIKMGLRLLWTGRHTPYVPLPCGYIFERQPGLVPFQAKDGWQPRSTPDWVKNRSAVCMGNAADCAAAADSPAQPQGLGYTWTLASVSSYSLDNSGNCQEPQTAQGTALNYPGNSNANATASSNMVEGSFSTVLWACRMFIDPEGGSCANVWNPDTCGRYSDQQCAIIYNTPFDTATRNIMEYGIKETPAGEAEDKVRATMQAGMANNTAFKSFYEKMMQPFSGSSDPVQVFRDYNGQVIGGDGYWQSNYVIPSATEAMLERICDAAVALLIVDSHPLQSLFAGYPFPMDVPWYLGKKGFEDYAEEVLTKNQDWQMEVERDRNLLLSRAQTHGNCDHGVYLEACHPSEDRYTIWSWGQRFNLSKEILLGKPVTIEGYGRDFTATYNSGILCGATVADQVSFAPET